MDLLRITFGGLERDTLSQQANFNRLGLHRANLTASFAYFATLPTSERSVHNQEKMGTEIKASTTDELRLRNYRSQLERRNDAEVRTLERKHADDMQRLMERGADQVKQLHDAYQVQISQEAGNMEDHLSQLRIESQKRLEEEKQRADAELQKLKTADRKKIEEFKRNSAARIDSLRKELQANEASLHEQARKNAKKEREETNA